MKPKSITWSLPISAILLPYVMGVPFVEQEAIAQTTFGRTGQDGDRGRDGRDGRDGQDIRIFADGKPISYDLTGTNGEDGEDGRDGRSASSCEQPYRPEYSLLGASGGLGGDGGNGGRGGNGGNVLIFYTDVAALKQIEIRNAGGKGGRNGRGAIGGNGCECQEESWRIRYCTIQTDRRPLSDPNSPDKKNVPWKGYSSEIKRCGRSSDEWFTGRDSYGREREYVEGKWQYRRYNKGVASSNVYTCRSGRDGKNGNNGRNGINGNYGKVILVPRPDIPQEMTSDLQPLASVIGKERQLVKNIWVERSGLGRLLKASSDVGDRYTYLQETARLTYRFDWDAAATPASLGVDKVAIGASITVNNERAKLEYVLPGTLEYEVVLPASNMEIVRITGGFAPDRVKAFSLQSITGNGTDNQLILSDRGNVRNLLNNTEIAVTCLSKQSATGVVSADYEKRRSITFKVPPQGEPTNGAIVNGNTYTLPIGRYCSPWLRAGNDAAYDIAITQITKSRATYTQSIEKSFMVGKSD